ncbi:MAG: aminopeptidase P N-terminal domain-containing protein [Candidatus Binatia bacterium]
MLLPPDVFARRRRALMDRLGPSAAAVFPAAPTSIRSNDVEYPYRQDNDFLYLTGFVEPEAACVLSPGHPQAEFVLFVRPRDPERETWTGRRAGVEDAKTVYGAQAAYTIDELDAKIGDYVGERDRLYYAFGRDAAFNQRVLGWLQRWQQLRPRSGTGPVAVLDPREIVHEMRLIKGAEEVACMRKAIEIAAAGHHAAMRAARDGTREYEIEALLQYSFRKAGGAGPAYPSIVASGPNATILHYTANDEVLRAGQLLLVDAGAEYAGYCSDVTRTFPVDGRFRQAQRALYDVVLQAQRAALDTVKPGARIDAPHTRALEVLVDGLVTLGILTGDRQEIISKELYRPFYMHRTSHWLGMDVHDVGKYKLGGDARILEPGMVLTVEPGLYIGPDKADVPERYRGIGIRIEDDVLVTPAGHEVLSDAVPKLPADLESLRAA